MIVANKYLTAGVISEELECGKKLRRRSQTKGGRLLLTVLSDVRELVGIQRRWWWSAIVWVHSKAFREHGERALAPDALCIIVRLWDHQIRSRHAL